MITSFLVPQLEKTAMQLVAKSKRKPLEVKVMGRASVKRLISHCSAHPMPTKWPSKYQYQPDQQEVLEASQGDDCTEDEDNDGSHVAQGQNLSLHGATNKTVLFPMIWAQLLQQKIIK